MIITKELIICTHLFHLLVSADILSVELDIRISKSDYIQTNPEILILKSFGWKHPMRWDLVIKVRKDKRTKVLSHS